MSKFRFLALLVLGLNIFFSAIALIDGVYSIGRSDIQIFLIGGVASSAIGFICLIFLKPSENGNQDSRGNVLSLWLKRRKLEEQKKIDELQRKS